MGKCEKCEKGVTDKVELFSNKKFGKVLCFECQKLNPLPQDNNKLASDVSAMTDRIKQKEDDIHLQLCLKCAATVLQGKIGMDEPERVAAFAKQLKKLVWECKLDGN